MSSSPAKELSARKLAAEEISAAGSILAKSKPKGNPASKPRCAGEKLRDAICTPQANPSQQQINAGLINADWVFKLGSSAKRFIKENAQFIATWDPEEGVGIFNGVEGEALYKQNVPAQINFEELSVFTQIKVKDAIELKRGKPRKYLFGKTAANKIEAARKAFIAKNKKKAKSREQINKERREKFENLPEEKKEEIRARKRALAAERKANMSPEEKESYKQAKEAAKFQKFIAGLSPEQLQAMIAQKQAQIAAI